MILIAVAPAAALALSGCDMGHRVKFKPGDYVIRKLTSERAVVFAHFRPFADDIYWLKLPGRVAVGAAGPWFASKKGDYHIDGPFYEGDLVLAPD
jgi:hypothetical protein